MEEFSDMIQIFRNSMLLSNGCGNIFSLLVHISFDVILLIVAICIFWCVQVSYFGIWKLNASKMLSVGLKIVYIFFCSISSLSKKIKKFMGLCGGCGGEPFFPDDHSVYLLFKIKIGSLIADMYLIGVLWQVNY